MAKDLYAVRAKYVDDLNDVKQYFYIGHDHTAVDCETGWWTWGEIPENDSGFEFRMPLELAKKHLTAYRELVKVEDDK